MKSNLIRIAIGLFFAAGMIFYVQGVLIPYQKRDAAAHERPRGNLSDLYPRWLGARELLLHGRDPYSSEVTREIQVGYYGRELDPSRPADPKDQQGFAYPIYVAFLLAPTVSLPFSIVQGAAFWFLLIITLASVPLWLLFLNWRPSRTSMFLMLLLATSSFAVVQGLKLQQLTLVVGAMIALTCALLSRGQLTLAGIIMATATIKPQLTAPIAGWLFLWSMCDWRNRKNYTLSFLAALGALFAASEWYLPGWMLRFREALAAYRVYTGNGGSVLDSLAGPFAGRVVAAAIVLAVMILCWRLRKSPGDAPQFAWVTCLVLTVTIVIIPTIAPYNQILLIPGILQISRHWPQLMKMTLPGRAVSFVSSVIVAWPWIAACTLLLLSLVVSSTSVQQAWSLPLYSSLFIPLAVLVLQGVSTRQSLR